MKLKVEAQSIQGRREYQQDAYGYRDIGNARLLFLADGMGGYKGGEIASEILIEAFMKASSRNLDTESFLEDILTAANDEIASYKRAHPDVSKMGTTIIAMLIKENHYRWISVGDSPIYQIRENKIRRINQNHSVAGLLALQVKNGEIREEEARSDSNRHMLTSAVMGEPIPMIDISSECKIEFDDLFILASDGIETLSDEEILEIVKEENDTTLALKMILKNIIEKDKPHQDNATLMILSFTPLENEENRFIKWIKKVIKRG